MCTIHALCGKKAPKKVWPLIHRLKTYERVARGLHFSLYSRRDRVDGVAGCEVGDGWEWSLCLRHVPVGVGGGGVEGRGNRAAKGRQVRAGRNIGEHTHRYTHVYIHVHIHTHTHMHQKQTLVHDGG